MKRRFCFDQEAISGAAEALPRPSHPIRRVTGAENVTYRHKQTGWIGVTDYADDDEVLVNVLGQQLTWTGTLEAFREQWEEV